MNDQRRNAIKFFARNAGFATPPGRMVGAKMLADAEALASKFGCTWEWEFDPEPWDGDGVYVPKEVLTCCMYTDGGELLTSLCGIADPDAKYVRVIQAELALEAFTYGNA